MATKQRVYRVKDTDRPDRLIRASTPAMARSHAAAGIEVEVATQDDMHDLASLGVKIEQAGEDA